MQLYFIRHGQSTNNARWELDDKDERARLSDPELTDKGIRQASLLAEYLSRTDPTAPAHWNDTQNRRGFGLTHIYCSLMVRAVQTGDIISEYLGLPLVGLADLHEVGGVYQESIVDGALTVSIEHGATASCLAHKFPRLELAREFDENGWWRGGIEDSASPLPRAHGVVQFLKERHLGTDDRIGVVMHGGIFPFLFRSLTRIGLNENDAHKLPYKLIYNNCGLTRIDFLDDRAFLLYHNRTDFLPADLIT